MKVLKPNTKLHMAKPCELQTIFALTAILKCHYDRNVCFSFPLFLTQMYVIGLDQCELL